MADRQPPDRNTVGGRELIFGVSAQPIVLQTLTKIGTEIKTGAVPSFAPQLPGEASVGQLEAGPAHGL